MTDADTALAVADRERAGVAALEHVLGTGDLSQLSNAERVGHYLRLCRSLGLNELSRPFDWIAFKVNETEPERLVLYPNQSCAAQLRRQHQMRVRVIRREVVGELFVVEVQAFTPDGREDFAIKYVPLTNRYGRLTGQLLANAMMKAETGAKRRVTLSMVGLATPPDEDDAAAWRTVIVDGTGVIVPDPTPEQRALAADPKMARAIGEPVFEDLEIPDDAGAVSQAARPDELERPERSGDRPTFKPTDEQINHWLRSWHAAVQGLSLDNDDERHRFIEQWTEGRTRSLRNFFASATERQANDLLGHVRALMEDERGALLEQAGTSPEDEQPLEAF